MKRYLWLLALPSLAAAQIGVVEMSAPTLSYVWEEQTHTLHPVEGVPGAASLGAALNLGLPFEKVSVAPGRRFATGIEAGGGSLLIVRLDGAIGSAVRSQMPAGEVSFSPSGVAVAISAAGGVEVWTSLPDQPRRVKSFPPLESGAQRLFVSDDGQRLLALASGRLNRVTSDGNLETIGEGFRDVSFFRNSNDVVAAHETRGIVVLRKTEADSEESIGAVESPMALALAADESSIAVLMDGGIALIERNSRRTTTLPLEGIAADAIQRVQGNAVFQLRSTGAEIWFLDGDSSTPRMVAVTKGAIQ